MAGSSNFVTFNPTLANAEDDATYAADASVTGGLTNGIASTTMHNKLFHQVSIVASMIGNFISGQGGAASDVDAAALLTAFGNAISSFVSSVVGLVLNTPTIADFTNANHAHDTAAHGGTLPSAAVGLPSGTWVLGSAYSGGYLNAASISMTITSGYSQTYAAVTFSKAFSSQLAGLATSANFSTLAANEHPAEHSYSVEALTGFTAQLYTPVNVAANRAVTYRYVATGY